MDKYQNKYRIASIRMQEWDYGWDAAYFITICSKNNHCYFGEITEGEMKLSNIGVLADVLWHEIPNHAKSVELGPFVVMPNHIHGVIIIHGDIALAIKDDQKIAKTDCTIGKSRFQAQGRNTVSSIVGSYKSAVTKHARRMGYDFFWQPRFYDHIIRDKKYFDKIADYIVTNPQKWDQDKHNVCHP